MRLYLHIGTEKTGSSYLQTLCAINRNNLIEHGFFFPSAGKREKDMLGGRISPGNASELSELINTNSWELAERWVSNYVCEAEKYSCSNLLLSNEVLNQRLSTAGNLRKLESIALRSGISEVNILLYIRDPADHALSLYRHRMKNGITKEFTTWLNEKYHLPLLLDLLLKEAEGLQDDSIITLKFRKYSSKGNFMKRSFFYEWLGVDSGKLSESDSDVVNLSLSLSELLFLSKLKNMKAGYERYMYACFLQNNTVVKADESDLIVSYKQKAQSYLSSFGSELIKINSYLPENEKLENIRANQDSNNIANFSFDARFTDAQMESIAKFILQTSSLSFKTNFMWTQSIKPALSKIKRKINLV